MTFYSFFYCFSKICFNFFKVVIVGSESKSFVWDVRSRAVEKSVDSLKSKVNFLVNFRF